ncbi:MAG: hypothetical protein ACKOQ8_05955 [Micrococcales bacterium]
MKTEARLELLREQLQVTKTWEVRLREEIDRLTAPRYTFARKIVIDGLPDDKFDALFALYTSPASNPQFDIYEEESELVICNTCQARVLHWQFENHTHETEKN